MNLRADAALLTAKEPLCTLSNFPIRGKVWNFTHVACNYIHGTIALADERGQIIVINQVSSSYQVARLAHTAISSIEFLHSSGGSAKHTGYLLVAYESGRALMIDCTSKESVGHLQSDGASPLRILKCHPSEQVAVSVNDERVLAIWDLRMSRCVMQFDATEPVVHIAFDKGGDLICVLFQTALSVLRTTDGCMVGRAELPVEDGGTQFISYVGSANLQKAFLADFRGIIHVFDLEPIRAVKSADNSEEIPVVMLRRLGRLELPSSMAIPVAMTVINETPYLLKVLLVRVDGRVSILEVPGARGTPTSHFKVLADIDQQRIFGGDGSSQIRPTIAGIEQMEGLVYQRCVCDRSGLQIVCLGIDGAVRIFHPLALLGVNISDENRDHIHLDLPTREELDSERRKGMGRSMDTKVKSTHASRLREGKVLKDISDRNETDPSRVKEVINKDAAPVKVVAPKKKEKVVLSTKEKIAKARKAMKKQEQLKNPLYKLAEFVGPENRVTPRKLKAYLSLNGEYPSRYRTLIWRLLLKLPENSKHYVTLLQKGPHPAFDDLQNQFPIKSRRVFERLHRCCCHLAHWSPHFAKTKYIAQLIFPFLLTYSSDEIAAFETVLTILNWWGHSWQATWPQPPVHILDTSDNLMYHHDLRLRSYFRNTKVSVGVLCWNMLSTLFTEVLGKNDWLILMDFLFSYIETQEYFYLVPIAIIRATKSQCMCISDELAIIKFYRYQQTINIQDIIRSVKEMYDTTPHKLLSIVARPRRTEIEGDEGPDIDLSRTPFRHGYDDKAQARESMADARGKAIFPLPIGEYPKFQGVADFIVDWQLRDRERAMDLDRTVQNKETRIRELEESITKMQTDFEEWKIRNREAPPLAMETRKKAMEDERALNKELLEIERKVADRKIQALEAEEKANREELELYEKMEAESQALIVQSEEFMNEKMETMLEIQRLRGMTATAEAQSQERISEMYRHKTRDMQMTAKKQEMEGRELEMQSKVAMLSEAWRSQDELDEQKRAMREKSIQENADRESFKAVQDSLMDKMQELQMSREQKIMEIERQRAIRMAREQADEAEDIANRARKAHQKSNELQLKAAKADIMEEGLKATQKYIEQTINMIREEGQKLIDDEKLYLQEQMKKEEEMRSAELRQEWAKMKADHLNQVLVSENLIQEHVLRMRRSAMEMEEMVNAQSNKQEASESQKSAQEFQAHIEKMGQDIVKEQRAKFLSLRERESSFGMQRQKEKERPLLVEEHDDLDISSSSDDILGKASLKLAAKTTKTYGGGVIVSKSYGGGVAISSDATSNIDVSMTPEVGNEEEYSLESLLNSSSSSPPGIDKSTMISTTGSVDIDVSSSDGQASVDYAGDENVGLLKTTTFNSRVSVDSGSSASLRDSLESITDESLRVLNETRAQARRERADEEKFISTLTERVKAYSQTELVTPSSTSSTIDLSAHAQHSNLQRLEVSPLPPAVEGLLEQSLDLGDKSFGGDSALWAAFSGSEKEDDDSFDDLDGDSTPDTSH